MIGYYRSRDGQVDGPFFEGQLILMWNAGQLVMTDQLCMQNTEDWLPAPVVMDGVMQTAEDLQPRLAQQVVQSPEIQTAPQKSSFRLRRVMLTALVLVVVAVGVVLFSGDRPGMSQEKKQYYNAKRIVKTRLVAPATAKFSLAPGAVAVAHEQGNGIWRALGMVDSQNKMGAMLRSEWDLVWDASTGDVLYARVGDEVEGDLSGALGGEK